ncbi:cyclin-like protein [Trichodelitschia bisporula]|uniref:RNA polymerase II holoenzyme cyclin-like subunit n=1 Tax=Trichodelitschia bisporula TaxID=703511 RepID=A0A6G1HJW0_9PEZI|nr:cyclin-like protein [Trichodelitschia bisporula]
MSQEPSRDPNDVLAEAEKQWLFSEDELLRVPSIVDGMTAEEERQLRSKGMHFITQVGIMLKIPQTTLSTAAVLFNRFLMRYSLVPKDGHKPLHHYQVAATTIFLATKAEEHCRKLRDLVIACCRVAQKNPSLQVDEQTKDFWRWRDTILLNEDVLLELLCFDLTIDSPYKLLYDMIKLHNVHHHKKLRDAAWGFLNDAATTQLCLLQPARVIAAAALYAGAKSTGEVFADDELGRPWWAAHKLSLVDIKRACNYMADNFEASAQRPGTDSIYVGLRTPLHSDDSPAKMTLRRVQESTSPVWAGGGSGSEAGGATKRPRSDENGIGNGHNDGLASKRSRTDEGAESSQSGNHEAGAEAEEAGSEEGEVDE